MDSEQALPVVRRRPWTITDCGASPSSTGNSAACGAARAIHSTHPHPSNCLQVRFRSACIMEWGIMQCAA